MGWWRLRRGGGGGEGGAGTKFKDEARPKNPEQTPCGLRFSASTLPLVGTETIRIHKDRVRKMNPPPPPPTQSGHWKVHSQESRHQTNWQTIKKWTKRQNGEEEKRKDCVCVCGGGGGGERKRVREEEEARGDPPKKVWKGGRYLFSFLSPVEEFELVFSFSPWPHVAGGWQWARSIHQRHTRMSVTTVPFGASYTFIWQPEDAVVARGGGGRFFATHNQTLVSG